MSRRIALAGPVVVLICCCAPGGASAARGKCARATKIAAGETRQLASISVLCLVNRARARRGLKRVRLSPALTRTALSHSRDMVARRYFAHVSPEGGTVDQRAVAHGYRPRPTGMLGETIVWGVQRNATPAGLVRALLRSPPHRRIMLMRGFRHIGVGLVPDAPVPGVPRSATLTLDFGRL